MTDTLLPTTLVLGIGNLVMSDDGAGVRLAQRLQRDYRFPAGVSVLDGGTLGLDLLPRLEGVQRLLLLDAVETGQPPGSVVRLAGEELPVVLASKLSPHQMGIADLLAVAQLQGCLPAELVLWGVQPACIEMGLELSAAVAAQEERLLAAVLGELRNWGVEPLPA